MQYYNEISTGYEELHGKEQQRKIAIIQNHIKLKKSDLLLDVGCGTGITTKPWNCNTIGLDPAIKLLRRAKNSYYINAEAESIPFKEKSFDIVVSITAIQNFHDIEKGLKEIKRVGKERFILSCLKRSEKAEKIKNLIQELFNIKKIIIEDKDIIFFI